MQMTAMSEGSKLQPFNSDAAGEGMHKLYIPTNRFLPVARHQFNHVTVTYFSVWLRRGYT